MTLTACPVGATWVGVLRTPTQVAWEQLLGLRPQGGFAPQWGFAPSPLYIYICVYVPPQASFFPKMACPPYAHPMSVNIQALRTRVAVWPEGPLRSSHINFLEKEIDCMAAFPLSLLWKFSHKPSRNGLQ